MGTGTISAQPPRAALLLRGVTSSRRRLIQLAVVVVVALAGLAFAASAVFGVHDNNQFELDVQNSPNGLNEIWSVATNEETGTFSLTYAGNTTAPIDVTTATDATIEAALQGLPGLTDVTVTGAGLLGTVDNDGNTIVVSDPWLIEVITPGFSALTDLSGTDIDLDTTGTGSPDPANQNCDDLPMGNHCDFVVSTVRDGTGDPSVFGDGNTVDDPAVAGDDWENVYLGNSSAFAATFIEDGFSNGVISGWETRTPEMNFFDGGGSKDTLCIQDPCEDGSAGPGGPWLYDTNNDVVPDKNDIVNAFAAAYDEPPGGDDHTIFYFGLDTFAVQGDNNVGFWFTRQAVGLNPLEPNATQGTFFGDHSDGDIFVAAAYTQGGTVTTVDVYRWDNTPTNSGKPVGPVILVSGADCATAGANDDICGVVNATVHTPAFPYLEKDGGNDYNPGAFVEFGLDVNALLGFPNAPVDDIGCFSSFIAETRSSQSLTAQLKDFALGGFPVCDIEVDKSGPQLVKVGDDANYTVTITNTGRSTLYKQSIIDSLAGDLTNAASSDCGASLAPTESCTITYSYTVGAGDPNPLLNTVDIVYTEDEAGIGLSFTDSADWEVTTFTPDVSLTKTADTTLSKAGDIVNYTVTVTNTSSANTPALTCAVSDTNAAGPNQTINFAAGGVGQEVFEYPVTLPADNGTLSNTASVTCDAVGFTNNVAASASWDVDYFTPDVSLTKTADTTLSKAGDIVNYTVTVTNTSSANTPALTCAVSDTNAAGPNQTINFAAGGVGQEVFEYPVTLPADNGTLSNTASVTCDAVGFTNNVAASASWDVDYFTPDVSLTKTADTTLSKAGDIVNYTVTVTNTSSANTPALTCAVSDTNAAGPNQTINFAAGGVGQEVFEYPVTLPADNGTLSNTASVTCDAVGFTNNVAASASWDVDYFTPDVSLTKTADTTLSKAGDIVNYTVTVTNTSSANTPALTCAVSDTNAAGPNQTINFAAGGVGQEVFEYPVTLPADNGTLSNTASVTCDAVGFTNNVAASASWDVDYFTPDVSLTKTADTTLSKAGDIVNYTVTVTNTSSANTPALTCAVSDTNAAGPNQTINFAAGGVGQEVFEYPVTLPADNGTLSNTASVTCDAVGFTNNVAASASWDVDYFTPDVSLTKTADTTLSKAGDIVNYTVTVTNTSSANTPALTCAVSDTNAAGPNQTINFAAGGVGQEVFEYPVTLPADNGTLSNTASVTCDAVGFTNNVAASASWDVDYFTPDVSLTKTADTTLSKAGDIVNYTVTVTNTSSANTPALTCAVSDTNAAGPNQTINFAAGGVGQEVFEYPVTLPADNGTLSNTASVTCDAVGFTNNVAASASWDVDYFTPDVSLTKTADTTLSKAGDIVNYTVTVTNTSSANTPALTCAVSDTNAAGPNQTINFAAGGVGQEVFEYPVTLPADNGTLSNTASVTCDAVGFTNNVAASASWDVDYFTPDVSLTKTADTTLSKAGDIVNYTVTVTNTSSANTPALTCAVSDTNAAGPNQTINFAAGGVGQEVFEYPVTLPADNGTLSNTASVTCDAVGFTNNVAASASWDVDYFTPDVSLTKTADTTLSKAGDIVNYTVTVTNTSSANTPALTCAVSDTNAAGPNQTINFAAGGVGQEVFEYPVTLPADNGTLSNTASVTCDAVGFTNNVAASASWDVDYFTPKLKVVKTGDAYSKVGDTVNYTVTVTNESSANTPALSLSGFTDSLVPGVVPPAACDVLAANGDSCQFSYSYTVVAGDGDPLENTATATYAIAGFTNTVMADDDHPVDLVAPGFILLKECSADEPIPQEGPATWDVTLTNTGDVDLIVDVGDGIGVVNLAAGTSQTFEVSDPGPFVGQATVFNEVSATWTLDPTLGLPNSATATASDSCDVGSRVNLLKLTNEVVDPAYDWRFSIFEGPNFGDGSGFLGSALVTDSTAGDVDGILDFDNFNLDPNQAYTICELNNNAAAGWTQEWMIDTTGDGVPDTMVPAYNPHETDPMMQNLGFSCVDFGPGTGYDLLTPGGTLAFEVNNAFPGGDPRTPGYWKNWSSCSNGGQYENATGANDPNNEFFAIDELLNDPGFWIGNLHLGGTANPDGTSPDCEDAVNILDHRDITSGKKKANDAGYNLARNLLAYRLNQAAGACQSPIADQAALEAQALLESINFTGTGTYLRPKKNSQQYQDANALAGLLDEYNNGLYC